MLFSRAKKRGHQIETMYGTWLLFYDDTHQSFDKNNVKITTKKKVIIWLQ